MIVRSIGVLSLGKIMGALYAVMGLIFGAFFALFWLAGFGMASDEMGAFGGLIFGAGAVIFFPLFYGILGFITGLISAFVYNLIAGWFGGLELDIQGPGTDR